MESKEDSIKTIKNYISLQYLLCTTASAVLREKFCLKWRSVFESDWINTAEYGKKFIEGSGKRIYKESKKIQKNILNTGNINLWDLPLLILAIKSLDCTNNSTGIEDYKQFDKLKEIRNKLSHQPTAEVSNDDFQKYWDVACTILISFGIPQKTLEETKVIAIYGNEIPLTATNSYVDESNVRVAEELKERGNTFFGKKQYEKAVEIYSSAIMLTGISLKSLAILYSNRSAAYLELGDSSFAKEDAKCVTRIYPTWWRGYARLAKAYETMKKYEQGVKYVEIATKMNPPESEIAKLTDLKYYCTRMFEKENRLENILPSTFINTTKDVVNDVNRRLGLSLNPSDVELCQEIRDKLNVEKTEPKDICAEAHKYLHGVGVPVDYDLAASRFAKAAHKGSADGMYNLGVLLLEGKGVKRDTQLGIEMLRQAAEQPIFDFIGSQKFRILNEGVSSAKHALALAYHEGSGVPKDIKMAFFWYTRALEDGGNGVSANNLGIIYENGELGPPNIEKAILYWKFAAFGESLKAMQNLARVYHNRGNILTSYNWYRLSVENGGLPSLNIDRQIASLQLKNFDSKLFLQNLRDELKSGPFKNIIVQMEEVTKNMAAKLKPESMPKITYKHIAYKPNDTLILEHRKTYQEMRNLKGRTINLQPAVGLESKPVYDMFGLKPILLAEMDSKVDKIYEGFAIKLTIIEDAVVGQPSVNLIGKDGGGSIQRIFVYNVPQNKETQDILGFGCAITIVNPYHRLCHDGRPAIRVDEPSSIIYHSAITDKSSCRYCGKPKGKVICRKCRRVSYCSKDCLNKDESENKHELVCVKNI